MRLAILSDIHGNLAALDAVLTDIVRHGGADGYIVLGDLAAQGYAPSPTVERLAQLPNARFVRGNTDRCVVRREWSQGVVSHGHRRTDTAS
jgi:predicted phosphodiesterase